MVTNNLQCFNYFFLLLDIQSFPTMLVEFQKWKWQMHYFKKGHTVGREKVWHFRTFLCVNRRTGGFGSPMLCLMFWTKILLFSDDILSSNSAKGAKLSLMYQRWLDSFRSATLAVSSSKLRNFLRSCNDLKRHIFRGTNGRWSSVFQSILIFASKKKKK